MNWKYDGVWLTTKQIAGRYGITSRRCRAIAGDRRGTGRNLGGLLVRTEKQADLLCPRKSGSAGHLKNVITKRLNNEIEQLKGKT